MKAFFEKVKRNYQKKSLLSKITDVFFIILLVFLIIPAGRKVILAAFISIGLVQPGLQTEHALKLRPECWQYQFEDVKSGQQVTLENFRGKVIFLNIWATWCPPCVAEMPGIQALYEEYGDRMVFIIASGESESEIDAFQQSNDYSIPFYRYRSSLPEQFTTSSIPATFIISTDGQLVLSKKGAAKWNGSKMKNQYENLLSD